MTSTAPNLNRLCIWQQNLNKSHAAQLTLLNGPLAKHWDVLALQEPVIDHRLGLTKANSHWRVVYPTHKYTLDSKPRAVTLVNTKISTNCWEQIPFPSKDVVIVQFRGAQGACTIFNIYNDGTHDGTLTELKNFLSTEIAKVRPSQNDHLFWLGDFNRHHPMWDEERNSHLFTNTALDAAQKLLDILSDFGLVQALPKDLPTLVSSSTGNWTRPDNVFCTDHSLESIISCTTDPGQRGPKTDHVPILTKLDLEVSLATGPGTKNYREVNWEEFEEQLEIRLARLPPPVPITTEGDFQQITKNLDATLRSVVDEYVPTSRPCPHARRWWTKELTEMKKTANRLSRQSYKFRALPDHPCHAESKDADKRLVNEIFKAKKEHWQSWLEESMDTDLWTAHQYINSTPGDGGRARIPTLVGKDAQGNAKTAATNEEKGEMLAKMLFPPPPDVSSVPANPAYPAPVEQWTPITHEQLTKAISNLSPYKAPGPDGVANIVFKRCTAILTDHLLPVFNAVFTLKMYYEPWRESITVILRKPGKPDYSTPKAYRPIALLNTTAKLLSAIVAERTSYTLEAHNLLPNTHFGGRPGRSTSDSLHLFETTVRHAWRQGNVVSALFLDIEGAFPNAVTDRLIHNMRIRRLPKAITSYTERLLRGRKTRLRFDDYVSDWVAITNGIGQGDPLSMILYIIYNSDLVDVAKGKNELALAFVDDTAYLAIGKTFQETHKILNDMLERAGGGYQWSADHNSRFEPSKFALIDFSLNRTKDRPPLVTRNTTITPSKAHKFLGVIIDQELRWREQVNHALGKGTQYTLLMRRLSGTSWGTPTKLIRQLYQAVVIPRVTYAASIWARPIFKHNSDIPQRGSIGVAKQLARIQRMAAITILGAMQTSPTDSLDLHAFLLPTPLLIQKLLYRSMSRMATLPNTHPLHDKIKWIEKHNVRRHKSALHHLVHSLSIKPSMIETIWTHPTKPSTVPPMKTSIASSKDESITQLAEITCKTQVFSDGSCTEGQVGAAAVLVIDGHQTATLRYHLGPASEHTVFEAELVGLILAAYLLSESEDATYPAVILADNQAAIQASEYPAARSGHYLCLRFRSLLRKVIRENKITRQDIMLQWIAGHKEVEGNEAADQAAKVAAKDAKATSPKDLLPPCLRKSLPIGISAARQKYKEEVLAIWDKQWKSSKRYAHLSRIDPSAPSKKFLSITSHLPKSKAGIVYQLRSGHVALNKHLHRINKSDTPSCLQCEAGPPETVHHFLFDCPRYDRERHRLRNSLGRRALSTSHLLAHKEGLKELMKYVAETGRFKRISGEGPIEFRDTG